MFARRNLMCRDPSKNSRPALFCEFYRLHFRFRGLSCRVRFGAPRLNLDATEHSLALACTNGNVRVKILEAVATLADCFGQFPSGAQTPGTPSREETPASKLRQVESWR
jgi:hypothetical protein